MPLCVYKPIPTSEVCIYKSLLDLCELVRLHIVVFKAPTQLASTGEQDQLQVLSESLKLGGIE
jgi:hypothetical protein